METYNNTSFDTLHTNDELRASLSQQLTMPQPALVIPPPLEDIDTQQLDTANKLTDDADNPHKKQKTARKTTTMRIIALACVLASLAAIYFALRSLTTSTETSTNTTQATSITRPTTTTASTTNNDSGSTIQVYIVGAVKHPGVYTLDANARIYQLLTAAGGPQADANLVAVNLAEALKDGEEVYIPAIGEATPVNNGGIISSGTPTTTTAGGSSGQLVNINTASATELRQQLHLSTQSANKIITYRTQHGPYTSVTQLANVVSKSIYDKIKDKVTV